MKERSVPPQQSRLYRLILTITRHQLSYVLQNSRHRRFLFLFFLFFAGGTALAILSVMASLTRLPLLFPQLGPSAFILFYTPMSEQASPRNVLLAHFMAVATGLLCLWLMAGLFPLEFLGAGSAFNWQREVVVACSVGLACLLMAVANCVHPPAVSSALIAALGYFETPLHLLGIGSAVVLLLLWAVFFNRLVGGLPYPLWRFDAAAARNFGELAGVPARELNFWRLAAMKGFQRRNP